MNGLVPTQGSHVGELLLAERAAKGLLTRVNSSVTFQISLLGKAVVAYVTLKRLNRFLGSGNLDRYRDILVIFILKFLMGQLVFLQLLFLLKLHLTDATFEHLFDVGDDNWTIFGANNLSLTLITLFHLDLVDLLLVLGALTLLSETLIAEGTFEGLLCRVHPHV